LNILLEVEETVRRWCIIGHQQAFYEQEAKFPDVEEMPSSYLGGGSLVMCCQVKFTIRKL
jgi:hypothetical protein